MRQHNAEVVYREYMAHARHIETQRLSFATFFSAVYAAVTAYVVRDAQAVQIQVLSAFLVVFALFGFLITSLWNAAFVRFSRLAERVAIDHLDLDAGYQRFKQYKKIVSVARVFAAFYALMIGLAVALSTPKLALEERLTLLGLVCALLVVYYVLWIEASVSQVAEDHRQSGIGGRTNNGA